MMYLQNASLEKSKQERGAGGAHDMRTAQSVIPDPLHFR
jgi:hypothetical protein